MKKFLIMAMLVSGVSYAGMEPVESVASESVAAASEVKNAVKQVPVAVKAEVKGVERAANASIQGKQQGKHYEMKAERKAEMEAKKAKMKEICKTDKTKCKAIKDLRTKQKAEMETLINTK